MTFVDVLKILGILSFGIFVGWIFYTMMKNAEGNEEQENVKKENKEMIKIIRITNSNNAWNDIEMDVNNFNKLISVLELSKHRHTITYENNGFPKTFIVNEKE